MIGWVFDYLWGWIGMSILVSAAAIALAVFFPQLWRASAAIVVLAIGSAWLVLKGDRNRARIEREKDEKVVKKLQKEYKEIDKRPDTEDEVAKRLRDGSF